VAWASWGRRGPRAGVSVAAGPKVVGPRMFPSISVVLGRRRKSE